MKTKGEANAGRVKKPLVVYSCYFGKYEQLNTESMGDGDGYDRVIFTDEPDLEYPGAQVIHLEEAGLPAAYISRKPKIMPHLFFPEHEWVIYVDNSASLKVRPEQIISGLEAKFADDAPAGRYLFKHPERNCAYMEAEACSGFGIISPARERIIREFYTKKGFPRHYGLFVNTIMIQKMGSKEADEFNEAWFGLFLDICKRDQITLAYALWLHNYVPVLEIASNQDYIDWPMYTYLERRDFLENNQKSPKNSFGNSIKKFLLHYFK